MGPMMIVDCTWKKPRVPMTEEEWAEYNRWCDEEHIPDLLRGTGMTRVTRFREQDDSHILYIQEFASEEALKKYLVSGRRRELRNETESHYPAGDSPKNIFEKRVVRIFLPIASKGHE